MMSLIINNFTEDCLVKSDRTSLFTFVNPTNYYFVESVQDSFDNVFSDGFLLTYLYRRRYGFPLKRFSFDFTSIAHRVFRSCINRKFKVALIGSKSSEIGLAIKNIKKIYPKLEISYFSHGFKCQDVFVEELKNIEFDLLICGMGSPLQENFLIYFKKNCSKNFIGFTCGGFLTQTSEKINYYPLIVDMFNLRWLYRFIRHSHVRKKVIYLYPKFIFKWFLNSKKTKNIQ